MKLTLSQKLYGLVGGLVIVLAIVALLAILSTRSLVNGFHSLNEEDGVQQEFALRAGGELGSAVKAYQSYAMHGDDLSLNEFKEATDKVEDQLLGYLSVSEGDEIKLGDEAKNKLEKYKSDFLTMVKTRATAKNSVDFIKTLPRNEDLQLHQALQKMEDSTTRMYADKQTALNSKAKTVNIVQIILSVMSIFAGLFSGILIIKKILVSIKAVNAAAKQVSEGDLSHEVPVTTSDEIGEMAQSFNIMIQNVRRVVGQIETATVTLAASSEELSATSEELSKGSHELASQTEQVVTAMTEVSQTIMDMAKNASQAADASKTTSETATQGKQVIETTANGMTSIATTVQGAATTIEELGRSSAQIGEIVAVINGIADQTNLLALNAAIEAARAGDQGRGFAVVADEVRKLAERTSQATKDIGQRITAIQQAASESVEAMKKGSDEVDKGVGLAHEASNSLTSIVTASSHATDMVQRIAAATEEQSAASEEVSQNMESIAGITRQTAASTEQIKASAEGLAKLAVDLKETAAWFKINVSTQLART